MRDWSTVSVGISKGGERPDWGLLLPFTGLLVSEKLYTLRSMPGDVATGSGGTSTALDGPKVR